MNNPKNCAAPRLPEIKCHALEGDGGKLVRDFVDGVFRVACTRSRAAAKQTS